MHDTSCRVISRLHVWMIEFVCKSYHWDSLTHSLTRSLTHSLTHLLSVSLTHSVCSLTPTQFFCTNQQSKKDINQLKTVEIISNAYEASIEHIHVENYIIVTVSRHVISGWPVPCAVPSEHRHCPIKTRADFLYIASD